jgi:hypothetical protein
MLREMKIDPDVEEHARLFNLDSALVQAVVNAEGPGDAIVKAVQCSIPTVETRGEAIHVVCRSAVHAMTDFIKSDPMTRGDFVRFFGSRWAPVGAANDPTGLNANWPKNLAKLWSV